MLCLQGMVTVVKAASNNFKLLTEIGRQTFIESHGHSASEADIAAYIQEKYTDAISLNELNDTKALYYFLYKNEKAAGYSKLILNNNQPNILEYPVAKLERIYFLKEYYGAGFGNMLLQHNIDLALQNGQKGIWLYVWKDNHRAFNFYTKNGFEIIGTHDFKISETHSNPNYQMLLRF
jgi:ribosomal protein S18 acetylase RimI-like enzyme